MKNRFYVLALALCGLFALSACSPKAVDEGNAAEENKTENTQAANEENKNAAEGEADATAEATEPTAENPIVVDKENKTVKV